MIAAASARVAPARFALSRAALAVACIALLAACGNDVSKTFGFTRDPPDEFQVATRAPLSVPPDFSLRPPRPGAPRPQESGAPEQAAAVLAGRQGVVVGASQAQPAGASPGERALLAAAGPAPAPDMRRRVDDETTLLDSTSRSFTDSLIFWRQPEPAGVVIDPTREQARLRENAALGRDQTAGDTPIIQRRRRGLLEGIF
jgi:hypothetical protein